MDKGGSWGIHKSPVFTAWMSFSSRTLKVFSFSSRCHCWGWLSRGHHLGLHTCRGPAPSMAMAMSSPPATMARNSATSRSTTNSVCTEFSRNVHGGPAHQCSKVICGLSTSSRSASPPWRQCAQKVARDHSSAAGADVRGGPTLTSANPATPASIAM